MAIATALAQRLSDHAEVTAPFNPIFLGELMHEVLGIWAKHRADGSPEADQIVHAVLHIADGLDDAYGWALRDAESAENADDNPEGRADLLAEQIDRMDAIARERLVDRLLPRIARHASQKALTDLLPLL